VTRSLDARLLGEVRFGWQGAATAAPEAVAPNSRKGTAMLVYLVMHPEGVRREALAELLWGSGKLASVRQALYETRRLPGAAAWLQEDGDVVRVRAASDVARFERAADGGDGEAALAAYDGPFLGNAGEAITPAYHDWWAAERDRLEARLVAVLRLEAERLETAGALEQARAVAERWAAHDPFDEASHQALMRLGLAAGDVAAARAAYARCRTMLHRELGSEPSEATLALAEAIERAERDALPNAVRALDASGLRALQAVALADGALGVEGLASVLDAPAFDVAAELERLERTGLVDPHLAVARVHRSAMLGSMTATTRSLLHERIAAVLREAGADGVTGVERIARHLLGAAKPTEAAPLWLDAARRRVDRGETTEAEAAAFWALWAEPDVGRVRLDACLLLEGLAAQRGDEALQEDALAEAERLAWDLQNDPALAEVRMRRSRQRLRAGAVGAGLELALEALEIAMRLGDAVLKARARNAVGAAHYFAGDLDGAADAFAHNVAAPDPIERYRALNNLGSLAAMRGAPRDAYRHFEEALTLARESGQQVDIAATLNNLAATADRLGDYTRAEKHFREGIALARRHAATEREAQLLANLAAVHARRGNLGPAWNTAAEVEELGAARGERRLVMHALEQKAEVARVCGDLAAADSLLADAIGVAEALDDERKRRALEAQRVTAQVLAGETPFDHAFATVDALESARVADIGPWLWLELAMATPVVREAERALARTDAAALGAHQRFVRDVATLRTGLLADAGAAARERAGAAAARLRSALDQADYAEQPLGRVLLVAWDHGLQALAGRAMASEDGGADQGPVAPHLPAAVAAALEEQARGLPRALAERLRGQPAVWLRSLAHDRTRPL